MAFASGSVTFRRYRMARFKPREVDDALLKALTANAFGRYGSAADADVEVGWVSPVHVFDVDFAAEKIAFGRFAHFAMRLDRNTIPGAILRSYIAMEEQVALETSGREFLGKREKRDAKETAKLRADKEARSGAFRRIATCPVLLDLEKGMLYCGATSPTVNEKLQRLFADTFEAVLEPCGAHQEAFSVAEAGGGIRALEDAVPGHLIDPPDDVDGDIYSLDPEDRGFLGREFLSWLWFTVDSAEGVFALLDKSDVAAAIAKTVQLKCDFNLTGSVTVREDAPATMPESRRALATGKQPVRMGLILAARGGEWAFVLDGERLDVSGVALPPSQERDAFARLEERFTSVADLAEVLDGLFAAFVRLRLSDQWSTTLGKMRQWAAAGNTDSRARSPRLVSA